DPALALRAQQLTAPATRRTIARTIRNLVDAAGEPGRPWTRGGPRPPLQNEDVLAARDELLAVAGRLSGTGAISPQAAALAAALVWDSASPVYARTDFTVWEWVQAILERLP